MTKPTKKYSDIPNISLKTLLFLLKGMFPNFLKIHYMNILIFYKLIKFTNIFLPIFFRNPSMSKVFFKRKCEQVS